MYGTISSLLKSLAAKMTANKDQSRIIPDLPYHPVILLPLTAPLLDLSVKSPDVPPTWSVGKYNEIRGIYTQSLFNTTGAQKRNVHIGIDLGAPTGVAVHAFWNGKIIFAGDNVGDGDYGPTIVTEHKLSNTTIIYALHGHLSRESLVNATVGRTFKRGEVLGWVGSSKVNGGWFPHVHFQISFLRPNTYDMPGVVSVQDREQACKDYPDPRKVLKPIRMRAKI